MSSTRGRASTAFRAGPAFLLAFAVAWLWPVSAAVTWPVGLLMGSAQLRSTFGWTTTKARKAAVKAAFGVGVALPLSTIFKAPWPESLKSYA